VRLLLVGGQSGAQLGPVQQVELGGEGVSVAWRAAASDAQPST
jgi:hypothetical protein